MPLGEYVRELVVTLQTMKNWFNKLRRDIFNEVWGEKVDHPLIKRSVAFIIDYLFTSVFSFGLLMFLKTINFDAEKVTILTNTFVALTYFSLLNSKLFRGQTIGKLITKTQTVDNNSKLLRFDKSIMRSIPVALLTISYPLLVYLFSINESLFQLTIVILVILTSASLYFPIANQSRQTFPDLILGTQVINKGKSVFVTTKFDSKVILIYTIGTTIILIYMYVL